MACYGFTTLAEITGKGVETQTETPGYKNLAFT
jgi:hypothetical protein